MTAQTPKVCRLANNHALYKHPRGLNRITSGNPRGLKQQWYGATKPQH